jgi:hypothetical protein
MPVDRGAIDRQLRDIGEGEQWWEQREFRDLARILSEDERIHGVVNGKLLGPRRPRLRPARTWLIVATDQRLICLQQEGFGRKQVDITADVITRLEQTSRFRSYRITVHTTSRSYRIRIAKDDAFRFARALAPLMPGQPAHGMTALIEPFAWIPGMTTVASLPGVGRIVSGFSALATPDDQTRRELDRLEATVDRLQTDVERLQEQVAFLEKLLEKRAAGEATSYLPPSPVDS